MNSMAPNSPIVEPDMTTGSAAPPLTALAIAGLKAVRTKQGGRPAIPGLIDMWHDLTLRRRRDLRTAVHMLARASGKDLAAIPFTTAGVQAIVAATTPAACGLSATAFQAYLSCLRYVLKRLGLMAERRGVVAEFMPAWAKPLKAMLGAKTWIRLRAFARFCSDRGVGPDAVDDAVLAAYQDHLRACDIRGTARETVRRVAKAWNLAAATVPDWPSQHLQAPEQESRQYSLPFDALPPSLQADIERFRARLSGANRKGLFQNDGPRNPLRPRALQTRMVSLRLAIAGLVHSGFPVERLTSLAVLLERDNMQALLNWHHARGGGRIGVQLGIMGATLAVLARHHVKLPSEQLAEVLEDLKEVRPPKQRHMTGKNERRLRQFDDPENLGALLHLPNTLFAEAERLRDGSPADADGGGRRPRPREAAWLAAVAVAIEIEFCCPLRLANLASLRLGHHLVRLGRDGKHFTHLVIDGSETKNEDPIRWPISRSLEQALDRYIKYFRPLAGPAAAADWLFPHRHRADIHREPSGLAKAIVSAIHRRAGLRVHVHLFRAFCGSLVLESQPEAIGDLQLLLGHRTMDVSMTFYRSRKTDRAAERLANILEKRRQQTRLAVRGRQARGQLRRRPK